MAVADGLSEPSGSSPPPALLSPSPLPLLVPPAQGRGGGEEGRREGRAQAAKAGRERGRSRRVGAGWLRRQDLSRRSPGMDSFPPRLLPSPLIFSPQVPTSHHTHLEATPTIFSPPPPTSSFPSYPGPRRMSECQSKGWGKALEGTGPNLSPNSTRPGPAPSPSLS